MTRTISLRQRWTRGALSIAFVGIALPTFAATNLSTWVYPAPNGRVIHQPDPLGNRVLDYSAVGYKSGMVPLPIVPVKATRSPIAGDDTANIQNAINAVSALALDTNGFRGVVLLTAGEYQIGSTLNINASGVVLRGEGSGTNGTVLRATATNQYSLIRITGSGSASTVGGTTHNLTNNYIPVGARSFHADSTSGLAAGDRVFVQRTATSNWIHDIGMDLLDNPWDPAGYNLDMDRLITRIEGNRIFINAPITTAIEKKYVGGTIRKYTWANRITNCGVEHLRGVSDFAMVDDENHGWILVQFNSVENAWARDVTSQYFGYACVAFYGGTRFATASDCRSLDPVSVVTGGRRYAFVLDDCTFCLVQNCYTDEDRHQFVTQSLTTGPNVFVDGLSDTAKSDAGPHHRWGSGALWDNVTVNGNALDIQNRGNLGSGHGWSGANEVAYNCFASSGYVVQKPPGAHNWLIGSIGSIKNGTVYVGPHDPGDYDSSGSTATNVFPNSLYYSQLQDRLAAPALQTREYWVGQIARFTNNIAPGESVPVDSAWHTEVSASIGLGAQINGFDVVSTNQWVPFTFNFTLATNEQVIAATLSLAMCASGSASSNDVVYLDSIPGGGITVASLGWNPISTATTNPTVRVLDLSSQLALLSDGKLNVAVQNNLGIDWALLELQVAPVLFGGTNVFYPAADATVRGGASAAANFGTATTLTVKEDSSNDNDRKAYLRWDLSSINGAIHQARIRLTPVSVGIDGIEQGLAIATSNGWNEAALTWNNQPGAGKRFATWIPATNVPVEVVVTPQVLDALAGDKQLSVQLYSIRNFGASGVVDYASREHVDVNLRPQLRLFMAGAAPIISDLTNQAFNVNGSSGPIPFVIGDASTPAASLVVTGNSSNTNLVSSGGIVFGGSDSNRTVTITSAPNQSGIATITVTVTDSDGLSASDAFSVNVANHSPGTFIWNGPGAGVNFWSVGGVWTPAGPPEAFDTVKFFDPGASGVAVGVINNVVDATFGGTIASLQFGNTNGNHTTSIPSGKTLNIIGSGLTAGTETDNGNTQVVNATMTGLGGSLNVSGGNLVVRQATDPSNNSQRATLDFSGVGYFAANLSRILVGTEGTIARPTGTLLLARTNFIIASGSSPAIAVGGGGGGSGNAGGASHIQLGRTNAIFADSIMIGRVKQGVSGGQTSSLRFNPTYTNANPLLGGIAVFRAADGFNRIASWNISDSQSQGGTVNTAGICDFTGGSVDALVDTMIVCRSSTGSGAGNPTGTLTIHAGRMDVNTLLVGVQGSATANGGTNFAIGTVNVNGGVLSVNAILRLGTTAGGVGVPATRGLLNLNGGIVYANSITAGDGTNNSIAINGGQLFLTNGAGPGLNLVALTNAVLNLHLTNGIASIATTNLVTGGAPTVINFFSLPAIIDNPAQFPVIQYSGAIGGAGFNFTLGSLPPAYVCGSFLSNNLANHSVDVVLTNCATPDPFLTWNGDVDGNWNIATANWQNNLGPGLIYANGNAVVFNDDATGETNINLVGALTPSSVIVSNQAKTFSFMGLGEVSGSTSLTKRGAGALIIANSGVNDFAGGVSIEAGTLQVGVGDADGTLPDGNINNNSLLIFNLSEDLVVNSLISGAGALAQEGPNELSLNGANNYAGLTTIKAGTVRVGSAAALGSAAGSTVITNGGALDVNGFNLGAEAITVSGSGLTNNGAIVNGGADQTSALRIVTLAGDTAFGGTGRWDIRNSGGAASLLTGGQPFKIIKVGANQVSLVGVSPIDPALGDIEVQEGSFAIQTSTTQVGDSNKTITVSSGATLNLYRLTNSPLNKRITFNDGAILFSENDSNYIVGPVLLLGDATFNANNAGGAPSLSFANVLSGPGGITKIGSAPVILWNSNSYSGRTLITVGTLALRGAGSITGSTNVIVAAGATLDASGRVDGKFTLAIGQTLSGNGAINGALTGNAGSTVSPGSNSIGVLTVSGGVTLNGAMLMQLNRSAFTNDLLQTVGAVQFGGTLMLTNLSGVLQANDTFKLFNAPIYSGGFTSFIPATPGSGLKWDASLLTVSGRLKVVAATPPLFTSVNLFGTSLVMTGTNGTAGANYYVLTTTNLALPLLNWQRLETNTFDASGNFVFTNTFNPAAREHYYLLQVP